MTFKGNCILIASISGLAVTLLSFPTKGEETSFTPTVYSTGTVNVQIAQYRPPPKSARPGFNEAAKRSIKRKFNDRAKPPRKDDGGDDGGDSANPANKPPGPRWTPPGM